MEKFEPNMSEERKNYLLMLRNSKVSKILLQLFIKHRSTIMNKSLKSNMDDLVSILIEELQKDKVKKKGPLLSRASLFSDSKNIDLIVNCLFRLKGFKRFVLYNNINMNAIRMAANFIEYRRYPQNHYLFFEGEKTADYFYGVIQGEVAILIRQLIKQEIPEDQPPSSRRFSGIKSSFLNRNVIYSHQGSRSERAKNFHR